MDDERRELDGPNRRCLRATRLRHRCIIPTRISMGPVASSTIVGAANGDRSASIASHAQASWVCFTVLSTDQKLIGPAELAEFAPKRAMAVPDLQALVAKHGGYDKITPEAWAEWDRQKALFQAQRRNKQPPG